MKLKERVELIAVLVLGFGIMFFVNLAPRTVFDDVPVLGSAWHAMHQWLDSIW